ncbi:uncharacterized protein LOC129806251 isoform X2 [Phlebotomus papatasi]|uniref:uncharacterized protein LOC129806251 isoform X2 n=1 Tax=Phlebotomus papatasi TaxID=29031 RepID=UPI002483EB68|nr:uncharacterized protein LOC129806251 isoform X2 [Phlebotomus papatasi]
MLHHKPCRTTDNCYIKLRCNSGEMVSVDGIFESCALKEERESPKKKIFCLDLCVTKVNNLICVTMKLVISILIVAFLALVCNAKTVDNSWLSVALEARSEWKNCGRRHDVTRWECLKSRSLDILNNVTNSDVIPIMDNIKLVRNTVGARSNTVEDERKLMGKSWAQQVLHKIASTLSTHHVEINLASAGGNDNEARRRRHHMLPMIAIGFTALGMILMPMGFQFLAVLGGKALLLAKLALILASINGLKRLAASGLSYGLYQNIPQQGPGLYFDRNDPSAQYSHPRAFSAQIPSQN